METTKSIRAKVNLVQKKKKHGNIEETSKTNEWKNESVRSKNILKNP